MLFHATKSLLKVSDLILDISEMEYGCLLNYSLSVVRKSNTSKSHQTKFWFWGQAESNRGRTGCWSFPKGNSPSKPGEL